MLGRGTRGGVADPSPVRRILPERRAQARFGPKAREAKGVVLVGRPKQHAPGDPSPVRRILPERRAAGALRAEGPRSEGRCLGLESKTTCAR